MNEQTRALRDLLAYCIEEGGPTPIRDALERWHELYPWQERRPIERTLAASLIVTLAGLE